MTASCIQVHEALLVQHTDLDVVKLVEIAVGHWPQLEHQTTNHPIAAITIGEASDSSPSLNWPFTREPPMFASSAMMPSRTSLMRA